MTTPWRRESSSADGPASTLNLPEILLFLERRWLPIVGCAVAAGVIVLLAATVLLPQRFRATATLVVVPPPFSSELTPEALPLRGFQRLLESDTVLAETSRRLAETAGFDPSERLKIGTDIESRIFVSRGGTDRVLAPIIEVVAYGTTPERAAAKSNVWAESFLDNVENLVEATKRDTIEVVQDQYGLVRKKLEELEDQHVSTASDYQDRLDALTQQWDQKLIAIHGESEDLIADQQTESRTQLENLAAKYGIAAPASASSTGSAAVPATDAAADNELRAMLAQVLLLRIRLAQTPSKLVIEKAVSDDGLWNAMALAEAKVFELQPLWNRSLASQEVNPVHTELTLRLATLESQLEEYADQWPPGRLAEATSELERLQRERTTDLSKLVAQRAQVVNEAQRKKRSELTALSDERDVALERISRDIGNQKERFDLMSKKLSQAELAEAEQSIQDVRLGSPAVAPNRPEPNHDILLALGAAVAGGVLGLLLALALELRAASA